MDGVSMNDALKKCEIVRERRFTQAGPGDWYFLKVGSHLISLGDNEQFADALCFALQRNAKHFDQYANRKLST